MLQISPEAFSVLESMILRDSAIRREEGEWALMPEWTTFPEKEREGSGKVSTEILVELIDASYVFASSQDHQHIQTEGEDGERKPPQTITPLTFTSSHAGQQFYSEMVGNL